MIDYTTIRVTKEQVKYLESIKIVPGEYIDSVLQRVIDIHKLHIKKVKR